MKNLCIDKSRSFVDLTISNNQGFYLDKNQRISVKNIKHLSSAKITNWKNHSTREELLCFVLEKKGSLLFDNKYIYSIDTKTSHATVFMQKNCFDNYIALGYRKITNREVKFALFDKKNVKEITLATFRLK